ncbi:MAG: phosphotriesterase-related protein [Deltaproteobacteria bacterium]|nr:phosphotriesterase-related protein [Deltaproteobacteria bacterium]
MSTTINTVTGTITPEQLGKTLMHEHVYVKYGGTFDDTPLPGRDEIVAVCSDYITRVKNAGIETVVDPTTTDLGRNAQLLAELAQKTDFNIICATGIYSAGTYLRVREDLGGPDAVTELFVRELTEGINGTDIKAGIIKVVTGAPLISAAEHELLLVAAKAAVATGAPIITHTEGTLGDEQQRILGEAGVAPHNILIGHSCLSTNINYHLQIIRDGSYLGFDRFGMPGMSDEVRAESLRKLLDAGCATHLCPSHDSVWYWVDGPQIGTGHYKNWVPTNFFDRIIPMLTYGGVTDQQIETMLRDNPRRFFAGEKPEKI